MDQVIEGPPTTPVQTYEIVEREDTKKSALGAQPHLHGIVGQDWI